MPKATTAGAPKTLPKVFQHEAIMQLLVKGSSNGSITGTEIANAQAEAALDLKQMKPVLTTLEAHDIEIVVDAPHTSTNKTRSGTKGGTVATARSTTAAATKTAIQDHHLDDEEGARQEGRCSSPRRRRERRPGHRPCRQGGTGPQGRSQEGHHDRWRGQGRRRAAPAAKTAAKKTTARKTAAKKTASECGRCRRVR